MSFAGITASVAALVVTLGLSAAAQAQPVRGVLMDNACASHHASEKAFVESHDKECLLMDACVKSGYSVISAEGKVLKFDEKGNALALDLIKKTDRDKNWMVAVDGKVTGDTIAVTSLKLQ